jgi:hypothetical protein
MSYAKIARDIIDLLEGPALNEFLFAMLAARLKTECSHSYEITNTADPAITLTQREMEDD